MGETDKREHRDEKQPIASRAAGVFGFGKMIHNQHKWKRKDAEIVNIEVVAHQHGDHQGDRKP